MFTLGVTHLHEIANYKGASVAAACMQLEQIFFGLIGAPALQDEVFRKYLFMIFFVVNVTCTLILSVLMKETKGKTEAEVAMLYVR